MIALWLSGIYFAGCRDVKWVQKVRRVCTSRNYRREINRFAVFRVKSSSQRHTARPKIAESNRDSYEYRILLLVLESVTRYRHCTLFPAASRQPGSRPRLALDTRRQDHRHIHNGFRRDGCTAALAALSPSSTLSPHRTSGAEDMVSQCAPIRTPSPSETSNGHPGGPAQHPSLAGRYLGIDPPSRAEKEDDALEEAQQVSGRQGAEGCHVSLQVPRLRQGQETTRSLPALYGA